MALQGTIDTFPFADVLSLISSSARSGQLTLTGDRGSGSLWVDTEMVLGGRIGDGLIVPPSRAVFELLRFEDGAFVFESIGEGEFPEFDVEPASIDDSLAAAREMLEQWRLVEAKVPSGAHRVGLRPELSDAEVTIDAATWHVLVTITRCSSVGHLSLELGIDDYECSLMVADLIDRGLVEVADPWDLDALLAEGVMDVSASAQGTDPAVAGEPVDENPSSETIAPVEVGDTDPVVIGSDGPPGEDGGFPDHFPIDDLIPDALDSNDDPWGTGEVGEYSGGSADSQRTDDQPAAADPFASWSAEPMSGTQTGDEPVLFDAPDDDTSGGLADDRADEVLRQMSTLSPSAAEAVAATLSGEPVEAGQTDPAADDVAVAPRRSKRRGLFGLSRSFGADSDDVEDPSPEPQAGEDVPVIDDQTVVPGPEDPEGGTSISYVDLF